MKINPSKGFAAILLIFGTASGSLLNSVQAQNNPTITVDENGIGTLQFSGGAANSLSFALIADPGPGGLASALTYNLGGPPGLVAGDAFILDPSTAISDIVRFNPAGTGTEAYPASLVFYSAPGEGAVADTGFPTANYSNAVRLFEGADGSTTYTPGPNDPGFVPGFGVTYVIQSSPETTRTPDSGSGIALLGIGLAGLTCFRRFGR